MCFGNGPLSPHIASFRAKLEGLGYSPSYILYQLRLVARFDLWLLRRKQRLYRIHEREVDQFLAHLPRRCPVVCRGAPSLLRRLLAFLREQHLVVPKGKPTVRIPAQRLVNEYRLYSMEKRGLDRSTIYNYSRHAQRFLDVHFGTGRVDLRTLGTSDICAFVRRQAPRGGRGLASQMVTGLRSFFRFAKARGFTALDLAVVVPSVPTWEISGPPKYLSTEAVQCVLRACDQSTVRGKRDYAILLLLARLGLRAGEIVTLQLDDIDWINAELTVRSKKGNGWAKLPLPVEVGRALAGYLKIRPPSPWRNVFVRDYAPFTPFVASGPVSVLVRKSIDRAGVKSARTGAHVLRHSLATQMLSRGASLDEIGRVLRHRDPDSTAIYAKVDLSALRGLALPWPGGDQ